MICRGWMEVRIIPRHTVRKCERLRLGTAVKCVGNRSDGHNDDDDYDDVILVLVLTVITWGRRRPESIESWVGGCCAAERRYLFLLFFFFLIFFLDYYGNRCLISYNRGVDVNYWCDCFEKTVNVALLKITLAEFTLVFNKAVMKIQSARFLSSWPDGARQEVFGFGLNSRCFFC